MKVTEFDPAKGGDSAYEPLCSLVSEVTEADAVVLMVVNGSAGHGCAMRVKLPKDPEERKEIHPKILRGLALAMRKVAEELEADAVKVAEGEESDTMQEVTE